MLPPDFKSKTFSNKWFFPRTLQSVDNCNLDNPKNNQVIERNICCCVEVLQRVPPSNFHHPQTRSWLVDQKLWMDPMSTIHKQQCQPWATRFFSTMMALCLQLDALCAQRWTKRKAISSKVGFFGKACGKRKIKGGQMMLDAKCAHVRNEAQYATMKCPVDKEQIQFGVVPNTRKSSSNLLQYFCCWIKALNHWLTPRPSRLSLKLKKNLMKH